MAVADAVSIAQLSQGVNAELSLVSPLSMLHLTVPCFERADVKAEAVARAAWQHLVAAGENNGRQQLARVFC